MSEEEETIKSLRRILEEAEKQERQWHVVLANYPGTEYARIAEDNLKKLPAIKETVQKEIKALH